MAQKTLTARIIHRNDTLANWNSNNPTLLKSEIGIVSDSNPKKFKIGDGSTSWDILPFYTFIKSDDADALDILAQMLEDDDFGKVDDVKVNGESVVDNQKSANISIATITYSSNQQEIEADNLTKPSVVLHRIAKTGSYKDLLDRPDIATGRSFVDIEALINSLNGFSKDELTVATNLYVQTLGVPDFWVYSIEDTNVTYTYTTDQALIDEINSNGSVQIGYYKISPLETTKVDLSEYAKINYVEQLIDALRKEVDNKNTEQDNNIIELQGKVKAIEDDDTILRSTDTFILDGGSSAV